MGGITCSKNLEEEDADAYEENWRVDVVEGVGDAQLRSDVEEALLGKDNDAMDEIDGRMAGEGVDTPRALARAASRCGGNGDFGGPHPCVVVLLLWGGPSESSGDSMSTPVVQYIVPTMRYFARP